MNIKDFIKLYLIGAKKKDEEVEEQESVEQAVPEQVEVKPNEDNLMIDLLPELHITNEVEEISDLIQVLKDYFKEAGFEVLYQDGRMLVPFENRVLVIGIVPIKEDEEEKKAFLRIYNFEDWKLLGEMVL